MTRVGGTPCAVAEPQRQRSVFGEVLGWLRALILLPLLVVYCGAIMYASIPVEISPEFIKPSRKATRDWLLRHHIRPGSFVFAGRQSDRKQDLLCIVVDGVRPTGEVQRLHGTLNGCRPGWYRVGTEPMDTAMIRASKLNKNMPLLSKERRDKVLWGYRNSSRLDRLSRYYCHSPLVDPEGEGFTDVYWTLYFRAVRYSNGKKRRYRGVVHHYDCVRDRRGQRVPDTQWIRGHGPAVVLDEGTSP